MPEYFSDHLSTSWGTLSNAFSKSRKATHRYTFILCQNYIFEELNAHFFEAKHQRNSWQNPQNPENSQRNSVHRGLTTFDNLSVLHDNNQVSFLEESRVMSGEDTRGSFEDSHDAMVEEMLSDVSINCSEWVVQQVDRFVLK